MNLKMMMSDQRNEKNNFRFIKSKLSSNSLNKSKNSSNQIVSNRSIENQNMTNRFNENLTKSNQNTSNKSTRSNNLSNKSDKQNSINLSSSPKNINSLSQSKNKISSSLSPKNISTKISLSSFKNTSNKLTINNKLNNDNRQLLTQSISFISSFSDDDYLEQEEEEQNSSDKVKTKLLSMWNNVKYGWKIKLKPTFNLNNEPIWLLGVCYLKINKNQLYKNIQINLNDKKDKNLDLISLDDNQSIDNKINLVENQSNSSTVNSSSSKNSSTNSSNLDLYNTNNLNIISSSTSSEVLENFKHDFYSRIWMTYRKDFKKIPGSNFRSDGGWGCMLRSAQMMLAQAFLYHYLPRSWRFTGAKSDKEDMIHRMLIKWFSDDNNSIQCPFSVHQLVKCGLSLGKKPGDWYGPSSVSYILKSALETATTSNFVLDSVCMYVAQDCTIYVKDLIKLCTKRNQPSKYKSLSALKKDKTNYTTAINNSSFLNGQSSYLKTRKRIRSSLKSLGSSIDLVTDYQKQNDQINKNQTDKNCLSSSAESNITSIDDVFTNSTIQNIIDGKSSSSFNLGETIQLTSNQLTKKNPSTDSTSSSSSTRSSKSSSSSSKRHSTSSILLNELKKSNKKSKWKSVIILIPLRLGGEKFNSIYTNCIKNLFKSPYCIGIIGGRPQHSLYFVGFHNDNLIYLDPHYVQDSVNTNKTNFPLNSYHCSTPRKIAINRIDPSLTVGFYCKTEQDLDNLIQFSRKFMIPSKQKINNQKYPIFLFDEINSMTNNNILYPDLDLIDADDINDNKNENKDKVEHLDSEEFVLI